MIVQSGGDGPAQVEAYLAAIGAGLHGPRRHRRRILAELRDGLEQAVAGRTATGLGAGPAAVAAIDDFGDARTVADAFAAELAIVHARRVLGWFVITGPLVGIWWLLLLRPRPGDVGFTALLTAVPAVPLVAAAIVTAAAATAGTGRLIRWLPETGPQRALDAVIAVGALALLADAVVLGSYARSGQPVRALAIVAGTASLVRATCSIIAIWQAGRMRRRLPRPGQAGPGEAS